MKLLEVDPQADARWQGLAPRARRIAAGVGALVYAMQRVSA
jgi:type II secretory pathway component PulM